MVSPSTQLTFLTVGAVYTWDTWDVEDGAIHNLYIYIHGKYVHVSSSNLNPIFWIWMWQISDEGGNLFSICTSSFTLIMMTSLTSARQYNVNIENPIIIYKLSSFLSFSSDFLLLSWTPLLILLVNYITHYITSHSVSLFD